jgi:hypothetical protein
LCWAQLLQFMANSLRFDASVIRLTVLGQKTAQYRAK